MRDTSFSEPHYILYMSANKKIRPDSSEEEPEDSKDVSRLRTHADDGEDDEMLVGTQLYIQPGDLAPWEEPHVPALPGPQVQLKKTERPTSLPPQQDPEDAITPNATIARKSSRLLARINGPDQPNARKPGRQRVPRTKTLKLNMQPLLHILMN